MTNKDNNKHENEESTLMVFLGAMAFMLYAIALILM